MGRARRKKAEVAGRGPEFGEPVRPAARDLRLAISLALAALVFLVFSPALTHDFINYDDPEYVSANPVVQGGLSADGIRYAFTSIEPYYWQPLTWLSLELDCSLFGSKPAVHIAINIALHAAAVVLLFLLLQSATAATWPSAFAAAIWAVHPLRVESVAWIAERKDVLSTLLFIATIFFYCGGLSGAAASQDGDSAPKTRRPRYALVIALYILALMAKPMVVTLPVVLLLVDIWPLRRRPTIKDKIPLAVLALAIMAVTFVGQRGAIAESIPLTTRLSNAVVSYAAYLGKIIAPVGLAILYPYTYHIAAWKVAGSVLLLIAISVAVFIIRKPHVTVGWLWYLITLVPVIGIVQAGPQSMADRFTYLPSIGIIVALVWSVGIWSVRIAALGIAAIVLLAALSVYNLRFWHDSISVFTRAIAVTHDNPLAHVKLGDALLAQNRNDEANAEYAHGVTTSHAGSLPLASAGAALVQQKRYAEAIEPLQKAVAADPNMAAAHENYGAALMNTGRPAEAIPEMEAALRLDHGARRAEILQGLGDAKRLAGRVEEGISDLRSSIDLKSTAVAWSDLGSAYSAKGDASSADQAFAQSVRLDPNLYDARMNYAALLSRVGRNDEAAAQIREAMRISPKSIEPRVYLAIINAASGRNAQAAALASEAQQMDRTSANEMFTRALHLEPKDTNLDEFIAKMQR